MLWVYFNYLVILFFHRSLPFSLSVDLISLFFEHCLLSETGDGFCLLSFCPIKCFDCIRVLLELSNSKMDLNPHTLILMEEVLDLLSFDICPFFSVSFGVFCSFLK